MGFNKVYKSLQEIFPQIDARVLRAVAIEHSKDADAAVETVLAEIIPFFTERSQPTTPLPGSISVGESSEALLDAVATTRAADGTSVNIMGSADGQNGRAMSSENQQSVHVADDGNNEPFYDTYGGCHEGEGNIADLTLSEKVLGKSSPMNTDVHSHRETVQLINKDGVNVEVSGDLEAEETVLDGKYPESGIKIASDDSPRETLGTAQDEDSEINQNMNSFQERVDNDYLETLSGTATNKESDQGKFCGHLEIDGNNSVVGSALLTVQDLKPSPSESNPEMLAQHDMHRSNSEELAASLPNNTASKLETASNIVGTEDESTLNASISKSSQIHIIDVLEEIIADARNNKKTLFSAMESVISLMREVELKEQAAEHAKVEAAMGGSDILVKSEELKQMLQQAEEENAMHVAEVNGEKAILATELRELQSRVLFLSDERNKSLAVLDEMRQTLEVRLAEAQIEIKSAEQEKLEKEKDAMKALANQELIMEKVVQESKILKEQAEDNAKLQEFLMDRGRVVDMLQGEIAVICQDVRQLKEKFDEHVPFSKSLSSSQTSCILASSSSSSKSFIPEQAESPSNGGAITSDTEKERGVVSCFTEQSADAEAVRDDRKALSDDGWEFFDNHEIYP